MGNSANILLVSRDLMLLQARKLILGTYFNVEAAGRISEARMLLSKRNFELIVLCDTLSDSERLQIVEIVRDQHPHPALLSLRPPGKPGEPVVEGCKVAMGGGPLQLLVECACLLGIDLKSKQRALAA